MATTAPRTRRKAAEPPHDPDLAETETIGEDIDDEPGLDEDTPLLDLSTTPKRPIIRIDSMPYELAIKDDFGVEDQHRLTSWGREYDELYKRDDLSDEESGRLKILLDAMFDRVAQHIPKGIRSKLGDDSRSQVVLAFTYAPVAKAVALIQAAREQQTATEARETDSTSAS